LGCKLISETVPRFSDGKEKYQQNFLDLRKNLLPLSRKTGEAMNRSDPAIPLHLS
jgi:hypothetical protein